MKRMLQLLASLLVGSVFAFSQGTTITLLHLNDTHSHLEKHLDNIQGRSYIC